MDRASLLADRDPCEHGRQDWCRVIIDLDKGPVRGALSRRCPGPTAKFTECETCGGSEMVDSPAPMGVPDAYEIEYNPGMTEPCPDCVLGLQGHNGWQLESWCTVHYLPQDETARRLGLSICHAAGLTIEDKCVFGWRAVSEVIDMKGTT